MKKINQTDPEDIKDINIISLKNTSKEDETHKINSQQNHSEKRIHRRTKSKKCSTRFSRCSK